MEASALSSLIACRESRKRSPEKAFTFSFHGSKKRSSLTSAQSPEASPVQLAVEVRQHPFQMNFIDMQTVSLTLRVLSRPDFEHLPEIYTKLGTDYDERVLPSIANEVLKAIVAQFNAGELITQRELVRVCRFKFCMCRFRRGSGKS